jgi:predicted dehydrogenase
MLAVMALEEHGVTPAKGEVLVTGAAGGVGSVAVAILAKLGYRVAAATGRAGEVVEAEDHGAALIGFAGGVVATLEQALLAPRGAGECYAQFLGSEGVLRVDTWQRLRLARGGGDWVEVPLPDDRPNGFDAEIREFVAAVLERRPPAVTGEDGRAALELVQAIYRAAESGQVVRLPLEEGA